MNDPPTGSSMSNKRGRVEPDVDSYDACLRPGGGGEERKFLFPDDNIPYTYTGLAKMAENNVESAMRVLSYSRFLREKCEEMESKQKEANAEISTLRKENARFKALDEEAKTLISKKNEEIALLKAEMEALKKSKEKTEGEMERMEAKLIDCGILSVSESGDETTQNSSEFDLESDSADDADGKCYECPDPEFYDFEKDRDANLFKAGQIWACYDDYDGMPRFYAKLTNASSFPFEVSFKGLEAVRNSDALEDWTNELPVGCFNFKVGAKVHKTCELFMFSHQMVNFLPVKKRDSLFLHPKEGEIWAVIKDWNSTWMSSPENHRKVKYEIVEVMYDFVEGAGCLVCYLEKVAGFVSLFHSTNKNKSNSFWIRPEEFSHLVPSSKMSGSERDGVPIGSYELDPAALPLNPDHLHFPGKVNKENKKMDSEVHCPPSNEFLPYLQMLFM